MLCSNQLSYLAIELWNPGFLQGRELSASAPALWVQILGANAAAVADVHEIAAGMPHVSRIE